MNDFDKSKEQLIQELESLRRDVSLGLAKQKAFDAQDELLKTCMAMQQTIGGSLMFKGTLQKTLKLCTQLTDAEESSLFVLDAKGIVTESILARGATIRDEKQTVIGQVLDRGLAGWVSQNRQIGVITDTMKDERWLTLPDQPYRVRSVLCIPILMGKTLLAIITLMHSRPDHFNDELVNLIQMIVNPIALVIDHLQHYSDRQQSKLENRKSESQTEQQISQLQPELTLANQLSQLGIYIITADAKFLYMNPRLVEIFGYSFGEFMLLESLLSLVGSATRKELREALNNCIEGVSKNLSYTFKGQQKQGNLIDVKLQGTKTNFYGKPVIIGVLIAL